LHAPEARHRPLSSAEWQVRIFSPIIQMPAKFLAPRISNLFHGRAIRMALVGYYDMRIAIPLHGFSNELQCRSLVFGFRDERLKNFAFTSSKCHCHCGACPILSERRFRILCAKLVPKRSTQCLTVSWQNRPLAREGDLPHSAKIAEIERTS
jgi:hypothetical protein